MTAVLSIALVKLSFNSFLSHETTVLSYSDTNAKQNSVTWGTLSLPATMH